MYVTRNLIRGCQNSSWKLKICMYFLELLIETNFVENVQNIILLLGLLDRQKIADICSLELCLNICESWFATLIFGSLDKLSYSYFHTLRQPFFPQYFHLIMEFNLTIKRKLLKPHPLPPPPQNDQPNSYRPPPPPLKPGRAVAGGEVPDFWLAVPGGLVVVVFPRSDAAPVVDLATRRASERATRRGRRPDAFPMWLT